MKTPATICSKTDFAHLALFELGLVFVRLHNLAVRVVNANHSIMSTAEKVGVVDCRLDAIS
jgi:hypothetical protein